MEHLHEVLIDFSNLAHSQEEKGVAKYGQPLDPHDSYDWLDMAKEEFVDGYKYLLAEQVRRDYVIKKIRNAIKTEVTPKKHDEIEHYLNMLTGGK